MYKLLICFGMLFQVAVFAQNENMAVVKAGTYLPLYGTDKPVVVDGFLMDVYPVTNKAFLQFVEENPGWRRSQVKKLFADGNYLSGWKSDLELGENQLPNSPVTNVSWYAAKNYCECLGKRLPTVDEWEYVALANKTQPDAREEASYNQFILNWYKTPKTYSKEIGSTFKNYWGISDLHGLVWEWALDFNSVMISGDSRNGNKGDTNLFCGAAALGASDLMNYAAFMRYAFRGSLEGNYAIKNLGFRCVKDLNTTKTL